MKEARPVTGILPILSRIRQFMFALLLLPALALPLAGEDWSVALIESRMAQTPNPAAIGPWEYSRSLYLYGAYQSYKRTGKTEYLRYVKAWVDSHVDAGGHIDHNLDALDDWLAGNLLIALWNETKDPRYRTAADTIRHRMDTYPRLKDGSLQHGSILTDQVWLDGLYMSMPFMMRYGKTFGDSNALSAEAVKQFRLSSGHLRDPHTGLYFHAFDDSGKSPWALAGSHHSSIFWARSIGWYGMAMVDVLDNMPKDSPGRDGLISQLNAYITAIARYQDKKSGLWFQVVDRPELPANWLETSSSSMFVYTIVKAVEHGYVPRTFLPVAENGYRGVLSRISRAPDGSVNLVGICEGTNLGDLDFYLNRARNTNDPHGLGAFLLMNEAMLEFKAHPNGK